ncbi:MAG: SPOR domain-containing protein [Bacteroidota bacterium]
MLKNYTITIMLILAFASLTNAQNLHEGKKEVVQDSRIDELVEKHIKVNEIANTIPGFRINIFFQSGNNSKTNANQAKTNFITKYPEVEAYVVFDEPNFKVKVGDFRTRMEARGFVEKIKADFPDAFVIKDNIFFPKINP